MSLISSGLLVTSRCILSLSPALSCLDVLIKDYYLSLSPRLRVPVPPSCVHRDRRPDLQQYAAPIYLVLFCLFFEKFLFCSWVLCLSRGKEVAARHPALARVKWAWEFGGIAASPLAASPLARRSREITPSSAAPQPSSRVAAPPSPPFAGVHAAVRGSPNPPFAGEGRCDLRLSPAGRSRGNCRRHRRCRPRLTQTRRSREIAAAVDAAIRGYPTFDAIRGRSTPPSAAPSSPPFMGDSRRRLRGKPTRWPWLPQIVAAGSPLTQCPPARRWLKPAGSPLTQAHRLPQSLAPWIITCIITRGNSAKVASASALHTRMLTGANQESQMAAFSLNGILRTQHRQVSNFNECYSIHCSCPLVKTFVLSVIIRVCHCFAFTTVQWIRRRWLVWLSGGGANLHIHRSAYSKWG